MPKVSDAYREARRRAILDAAVKVSSGRATAATVQGAVVPIAGGRIRVPS